MPEPIETLPIKIEPIVEKIKQYLPAMESGSARAVARLQEQYDIISKAVKEYDGAPNEEIEALSSSVSSTLGRCKDAYELWNKQRMEITGPMDQFKKDLMEYEKSVSPNEKDNLYAKNRAALVAIENKKLAYQKQKEDEARRKKELEDYKVDVATKVKKNLAQMLIDRVSQADSGSREFWKATTLENFDERAKVFTSGKLKLKQETYDLCFNVPVDYNKITTDQLTELITKLKSDETYEAWNNSVIEAITPTVNEWRAKIPSIKEELQAIANAKGEEAKAALIKKQQDEADADAERKRKELEDLSKSTATDIEAEADKDKMQNMFVEQVSTQALGTANTKRVYVVRDEKLLVKALCNAIYHTVSNDKFPGLYKTDRAKKVVINEETGKPFFRDEIQWWFDFAAANCDVALEGMDLIEVAKVLIRK